MADYVKGFLFGSVIIISVFMTLPWLVRLLDVWKDYADWVVGL